MSKLHFEDIHFKVMMPEFVQTEEYTTVTFKPVITGTGLKVVALGAQILDCFKQSHESNETADMATHNVPVRRTFAHINRKKLFFKDATLRLYFLTSEKRKIDINYRYNGKIFIIAAIEEKTMTEEEWSLFKSTIARPQNKEVEKKIENRAGEEENLGGIVAEQLPEMKTYIDALEVEKRFIKNQGGRQYTVANGRFIGKIGGAFCYVFDLENEVFIPEDAPVTLHWQGIAYEGTMLLCEDFQIIIQLPHKIGETVSVAKISAAPWKLLEALQERLKARIGLPSTKVAKSLLKSGPAQATKEDISKVPKGQENVIERAMNDPVTIVWGPPGTGKTYTMSKIALNFLKLGKTVLIVSHSNVSVDGVSTTLFNMLNREGKHTIYESGQVLRYGYIRDEELRKNKYISSFKFTAEKNENLNNKLDGLQEKFDDLKKRFGLRNQQVVETQKQINAIRTQLREEEQRYVNSAKIVTTTISKVVIDKIFETRVFDVVMFDEVSMAYVPQVACAATFAKEHFVCVGDFWQLAPIAQSEAQKILGNDIFKYLGIMVNGYAYYHPWLVMLNEQRRMVPSISDFPRKKVYKNLLMDHESVIGAYKDVINAKPFCGDILSLINLTSCYSVAGKDKTNSRFNILSGLISFATAIQAEQGNCKASVITPYVAQTRLVRALVQDYRANMNATSATQIRCATVHQFQGSESDVVLFDSVESFPAKKPGWLLSKDILSIKRLINVAVTRAKGKLITVSNCRFWDDAHIIDENLYYSLQKYLIEHGNETSIRKKNLKEYFRTLSVNNGPQFFLDVVEYKDKLLKDIAKAKSQIVISLPSGVIDESISQSLLTELEKARDKGITILCKSGDYKNLPDNWKSICWGSDDAIFPVIVIDDAVVWYGAPKAEWKFVFESHVYGTGCHLACRIKGEHTAELINTQANLKYREVENTLKPLTPKAGIGDQIEWHEAEFPSYISERRICQGCKQEHLMIKVNGAKTFLWCERCKKPEFVKPEEINLYITNRNVTCPKDGGELRAGIGKFGIYIKCSCGHCIKADEI